MLPDMTIKWQLPLAQNLARIQMLEHKKWHHFPGGGGGLYLARYTHTANCLPVTRACREPRYFFLSCARYRPDPLCENNKSWADGTTLTPFFPFSFSREKAEGRHARRRLSDCLSLGGQSPCCAFHISWAGGMVAAHRTERTLAERRRRGREEILISR